MLQPFWMFELTLPREQYSLIFESIEYCLSNTAPERVHNIKTRKVLEPFILQGRLVTEVAHCLNEQIADAVTNGEISRTVMNALATCLCDEI